MKLKIKLIVFLALLLFPGQALAAKAPATPAEWSAAVQKTYAGYQSMGAEFDQTFVRGESGITEDRQGRFLFQKPLRVRWATDAPYEELLIVTDELIWQYDAFEEIAYKAPIEALDDKNAFLQVLFGLSSLADTFKITVQPAKSGDDGLAHLLLEPYEPTSSLMLANIWLEPKSALIRRIEIRDAFGNLNRVNLKTIDKNPRVPAGTFEFTPPPGVEVEDRTK